MMKNKVINLVIDLGTAVLITGIIAFFLIGEPVGNLEEKTTEAAILETQNNFVVESTTTKVFLETTEETTTEVEESTAKVVEETTTEVVTVAAVPNLRAEAEPGSNNKYSEKDVYLFAQILYCEAGGESRAEMARVGKVVLNRVNTDYYEFASCNSINQVLRQPGQYPETVAKIDNGIVPSQDSIEVAEGLLSGTIKVPELSDDVLWQTGFVPNWNARVVYQSNCHYYSVYAG